MRWAVLSVVIGAAISSPLDQDHAASERDEKFLSVFQIVKFKNDECDAADGNKGTCYTEAECNQKGGAPTGNCASGFGVCCVAVVDPCNGGNIAQNNSYIVNPGYPGTVSSGAASCDSNAGASGRSQRQLSGAKMYEWTINKAASDIIQLRFDFIEFKISDPMMGDCTNDTFTITGADPVSQKTIPSNLCGDLKGQHIYVSMKQVDTVKVMLNLASIADQKFKILVRQFDNTQDDYLAPRGCLQYFRQDAGTIMSFNNANGQGELLNNQMYTACIAQNDAYCDISLEANNFDMTGSSGMCSDSVSVGFDTQCGTTFGQSGSLLWNYTGSYNFLVKSDADNSAMVAGFQIGFILLPC